MPKPNPQTRAQTAAETAAEPVVAEIAAAIPGRRAGLAQALRRWLLRVLPFVLLAAAAIVLWREFRHLSFSAVAAAMDAWGHARIAAALALAAASFVLMGVIEWLGLRWAGARLPWWPALWGSFLANAIAHSVGANLLVSGAVRARLYDRYGVGLTQVAATTLFGGVSFAVGLAALGGSGLLLSPRAQVAATAIPLGLARGAGAALVLAALGYILVCGLRKGPWRAFGRSLALPSARDAILQTVIGVADNGIAAAIVWILLPPHVVQYATFVGAYAVAAVAGLISTVPAGAGVFEGSISTLLPGAAAAPLAAAFLGYRLFYYLLPLVLACVALAADTLRRSRR